MSENEVQEKTAPREAEKGAAATRAAAWLGWGAIGTVASGLALPWWFWLMLTVSRHGGEGAFREAYLLGPLAVFCLCGIVFGRGNWRWERAVGGRKKWWRNLPKAALGIVCMGLGTWGLGFPGLVLGGVGTGFALMAGGTAWGSVRRCRWGGACLVAAGPAALALGAAGAGVAGVWTAAALVAAGLGLVLWGLSAVAGGTGRAFLAAWACLLLAWGWVWQAPARAEREADAARTEALERIGGGWGDGVELPGVREPVAEAEDPLAVFGDAIEAESKDFSCSAMELAFSKWRPPEPGDLEAARAWLEGHPALVAVAETLAEPSYRSCLEGARKAGDLMEGLHLEPRNAHGFLGARILAIRACLAFEEGDTEGALADVERIGRLAERLDSEAMSTIALVARVCRWMPVSDILPKTIAHWPDEALDRLVREAERMAGEGEGDFRRYAAREILLVDAAFEIAVPAGWKPVVTLLDGKAPLPGGAAMMFWAQRDRRDIYRDWAWWFDALERLAAMPSGGERHALWEEFKEEGEARMEKGLLWQTILGAGDRPGSTWRLFAVEPRTQAEFTRAAVAVERWRRAHGGALPESLEALVPEYLAEVPRNAWTGEPLAYDPGPLEFGEERRDSPTGEKDRLYPARTVPGFRLAWPDSRSKPGKAPRMKEFPLEE